MADFTPPPLVIPDPPAPLPTTIPLGPPMVGFASPFDHADGQNRDVILEAIRTWARESLPQWAAAWGAYQDAQSADIGSWSATFTEAVTTYLVDSLTEQNAHVSEELAEAVAEIVNSTIVVTDPVVTGIQRDHFKTVRVQDYPGTTGGGTGRFTDKLAEAYAAVAPGGTVMVAPGVIDLDGDGSGGGATITITKDVVFDFDGVTFVNKGTSGPVLTFTGTFDTPHSCASILPSTLGGPAQWAGGVANSGNPTTPIDAVTLGLVAPMDRVLRRGDVVKVVNDTPLEGQRDEGTAGWSPTTQPAARYGQFMTVESQNAARTSLVLAGTLQEFTKYNDTNTLRVAYLPAPKLTIRNLRIDLPEGIDPGARAGVRLANLVGATLENPTIAAAGALLSVVSCYNTTIINPMLGPGRDDASVGSFGYGIFDNGSMNTLVLGGTISHVRHAFTDDSTRFMPGGSISAYGRSLNAKVVGTTAIATTNTAFDTHLHGAYHQFADCTVVGCWRGFSLRGMQHVVTGGVVQDTPTALVVTDEVAAGGWSWGHRFDGVRIIRAKRVFSGYVNGTGHPNQNTGERRSTVVTGLHATEITERAIDLGNMNLIVDDSVFSFTATDTAGGLFNIYGAGRLVSDSGLRVELRGLTGAKLPTIPVFYLPSSTADMEVSGLRVRNEAALTAGLVSIPAGTGSFLVGGLLTFGSPSTFPDGNIVSWAAKDGTRPSGLIVNNDALFVTGTFQTGIADVDGNVTVRMNLGSNGLTLPTLPNGRRIGQTITLINSQSSRVFTINSASNVLLPNGTATPAASITVPIGGVAMLQWQGTQWVKVVG